MLNKILSIINPVAGLIIGVAVRLAPELISKVISGFVRRKFQNIPSGSARLKKIGELFKNVGGYFEDGRYSEDEIALTIADIIKLLTKNPQQ